MASRAELAVRYLFLEAPGFFLFSARCDTE